MNNNCKLLAASRKNKKWGKATKKLNGERFSEAHTEKQDREKGRKKWRSLKTWSVI